MSKKNPLIWQFTGQGCQTLHMGESLLRTSPVYRHAWEECVEIAKTLNLDLSTILASDDPGLIQQTQFSQPYIFAFQYALSRHLLQEGPQPDLVIGHSIGEFCAAVCANILSLENALKIIVHRASLMNSQPHGESGMMAVKTSIESIHQPLQDFPQINVSTHNAPDQVVVSGPLCDLKNLQNHLKASKIRSILLRVSHGFHSPAMQPIIETFEKAIAPLNFDLQQPKGTPFLSTADLAYHRTLDASYWSDHIIKAVQYWPAITQLSEHCDEPCFVEIGPSPVLTKIISNHTPYEAKCPATSLFDNEMARH